MLWRCPRRTAGFWGALHGSAALVHSGRTRKLVEAVLALLPLDRAVQALKVRSKVQELTGRLQSCLDRLSVLDEVGAAVQVTANTKRWASTVHNPLFAAGDSRESSFTSETSKPALEVVVPKSGTWQRGPDSVSSVAHAAPNQPPSPSISAQGSVRGSTAGGSYLSGPGAPAEPSQPLSQRTSASPLPASLNLASMGSEAGSSASIPMARRSLSMSPSIPAGADMPEPGPLGLLATCPPLGMQRPGDRLSQGGDGGEPLVHDVRSHTYSHPATEPPQDGVEQLPEHVGWRFKVKSTSYKVQYEPKHNASHTSTDSYITVRGIQPGALGGAAPAVAPAQPGQEKAIEAPVAASSLQQVPEDSEQIPQAATAPPPFGQVNAPVPEHKSNTATNPNSFGSNTSSSMGRREGPPSPSGMSAARQSLQAGHPSFTSGFAAGSPATGFPPGRKASEPGSPGPLTSSASVPAPHHGNRIHAAAAAAVAAVDAEAGRLGTRTSGTGAHPPSPVSGDMQAPAPSPDARRLAGGPMPRAASIEERAAAGGGLIPTILAVVRENLRQKGLVSLSSFHMTGAQGQDDKVRGGLCEAG